MIIPDQVYTLPNGKQLFLVSPVPEEAADILKFSTQIASETPYTGRRVCDVTQDVQQVENWIVSSALDPNYVPVFCYLDGTLVGCVTVNFYGWSMTRHRAELSFTVLQDYWGTGISDVLMTIALRIMEMRPEVERAEVGVFQYNNRARAFYERYGFHIVSVLPDAVRLANDMSLSEYTMVKQL